MSRPGPNRRQLLLFALAGVLAALFVLDRFVLSAPRPIPAGPREPSTRPVSVPAPAGMTRAEPYLEPLSHYEEAIERPLFSPDRRPPAEPGAFVAPAPASEPARAPVPPPDLDVLGLAVDREAGGSALVRLRGQIRRVYPGEEIEGWRIARIDRDGLTLERDEESWRFPLTPVQ